MDLIKNQLFCTRTLPYITKKRVNDALCKRVLSQLDRQFYAKVYEIVRQTIQLNGGNLENIVLHGDAAAAAYIDCEFPAKKINIRLCGNNVDTKTATEVVEALSLHILLDNLRGVVREYNDVVKRILDTIELADLIGDVQHEVKNATSSPKVVMFKSYTDEAYEFPPSTFVHFMLNSDLDVKLTASTVNEDEYVLVRYSYNVHAVSDLPIWLHAANKRSPRRLCYVPLDVYFLDVRVVAGGLRVNPDDDVKQNVFTFGQCQLPINVDLLDTIICEQLDCLLFNVFHLDSGEINERMQRLNEIIAAAASKEHETSPLIKARRHQFYRLTKSNTESIYTARSVKEFLRGAGSRLGARLVVELYFMRRFHNNIRFVTHQINFPYHVWNPYYYSACWKQYCRYLNDLFSFSFHIN
ncbi:hypothetical protein [Orgyia leucostigma nucleopolyhedrovirus]|uniref:Uncharacterized protein n=1 Tax=Orgyia leucostigma nucleopolyhedrovirus TaxID=490711 RepID=B0FDZ1_9ABAC|nr:hypothetical protein [Orgyia leucostigma nucleopolyhedrovirus]ABY65849.1 hypothetical protein [Orgyia leucostigma nucleopolyhedrovirus]